VKKFITIFLLVQFLVFGALYPFSNILVNEVPECPPEYSDGLKL